MDRGGKESRLADVLRRLDRRRYEPFLGVLHGGRLLAELDGVGARPRLARFSGDPVAALRTLRLARDVRPDVVWCVGHGLTSVLGLLAARRLGVPAVVSVHGLERPDERLFGSVARRLVRRAARVVILTETYRERLLAEGVRPEQLVVQPNGIELTRFGEPPPDRARGRRELGADWPGPALVHVGSLSPAKAQHVLLLALGRLRQERPDVGLVMVGDGPLRPRLERQIGELALGPFVRMLGERPDVPRLLPLFDGFVLSSEIEACPNVAIEAMASKLPVVATDAGGTREVVAHGETGYIVPVGDPDALAHALTELLADPARAAAMGEAGLRRARERFSLDRMVQERMRLFDEVVGPRTGSSAALRQAR
jgi:glycosyltransferase involved in cell wall biosynthesis